jgi:hypothetical protein
MTNHELIFSLSRSIFYFFYDALFTTTVSPVVPCISYNYTLGIKTYAANGLPQPLRFLARFFTTLFDPLCGDVAVATAERVSPVPATAGKLSI